jgi:hypothetical protein
MRVPRLYRVAELGDDRLAVWMEDVRTLEGGWDLARFARVELACLPMLERDETWAHPLVAGAGDERLRGDLRVLAGRLGELLDRMDVLPQAMPHGDASPQTCSSRSTTPTASWPSTCRSRPPRRLGSTSASCWSA